MRQYGQPPMTGEPERRLDAGETRERLTRLETIVEAISERVGVIGQRVHDLMSHVTTLTMNSERATEQHAEMLVEIRAARAEAAQGLAQHDRRDDERFAAAGARLEMIERDVAIGAAVGREKRQEAERDGDRRHDLRVAIIAGVIGVAGALLASHYLAVWTVEYERAIPPAIHHMPP